MNMDSPSFLSSTRSRDRVPPLDESIDFIRSLKKESVQAVLARKRTEGELVLQPRSGVGAHDKMLDLLQGFDAPEAPHILSMTIDSHTRLLNFEKAYAVMLWAPDRLNGYPLVAHGWQRGRELNLKTRKAIEVRHGSPDPRALFEYAIASGLTSFEGGGIGYNIPYCQGIPIVETLRYWQDVDNRCGDLARAGIIVDREYFGTLTAVLMPPSISIACVLLEAVLAHDAGVACHTLAICQSGNAEQDIAALRVLRRLASEFLFGPDIYVALHQFMGVFPQRRVDAEALILLGALVARHGGADKVITKSYQEAIGIPSQRANLEGITLTNIVNSPLIGQIDFDSETIAEEEELIEGEVRDLLKCVLNGYVLIDAIGAAFARGWLDVPLSANSLIRSEVLPVRVANGAVRFFDYGNLAIGDKWRKRNNRLLGSRLRLNSRYEGLRRSVFHFSEATTDRIP
jgi:methylaspartate mutase epsilon subunit